MAHGQTSPQHNASTGTAHAASVALMDPLRDAFEVVPGFVIEESVL